MTWAQSLEVNDTDGIIVLHKGTIIYEHYSGCLNTLGQHGSMSVTKSITGLLGEVLVAESILDEAAKVSTIVPELADSAFGDATIREVMDMTTGLQFSEDYTDPNADVWIYSAAGSPLLKPETYQGSKTYYEYLQTVRKQGEHGDAFGCKTINSDALEWIIASFASHPLAGNAANDPTSLPAYEALADYLLKRDTAD